MRQSSNKIPYGTKKNKNLCNLFLLVCVQDHESLLLRQNIHLKTKKQYGCSRNNNSHKFLY